MTFFFHLSHWDLDWNCCSSWEKTEAMFRWLSMWLVSKKEPCLKAFVHWTTTEPTTGLQNIASMFQTMAAYLQTIFTFTLTSLSVRNIKMTQGISHLYLRLALVKCYCLLLVPCTIKCIFQDICMFYYFFF